MTVGIPTQRKGKAMFTITIHFCMADTREIVTDNPAFYIASLDMLRVQALTVDRNVA
jgi:hypothetical protein